jgi:FAD:protein FMN transferase
MTAGPHVTTFDAIGTSVHVSVRRARDLGRARRLAVRVLRDVDEVASRFRPDSDLSRLNARPGEWVEVDPLLVTAIEVACTAADATAGLVNPLLGRPLVELGYDRDLGELRELDPDPAIPPARPHPPAPDAWRAIALDRDGAARIPAGTALDLGATGKAWASDLIAAGFEQELDGPALVSVGGDLRVSGCDGEPWLVAVSEAPGDAAQTLVGLDRGGLATSTTTVRRWTRHGVRRHHLLDPRTGEPTPEVWRTVSATGDTCVAANTATTAAIVLGAAAPAWLDQRAVTARLVSHDGRVRVLGGWPADTERSA